MPERIQRKRTKGWKMPPNTVYVGRGSRWGNPYIIGKDGDRAECIRKYRAWLLPYKHSPPDNTLDKLYISIANAEDIQYNLKGKDLACWCKEGELCHADSLLKIANDEPLGAADFENNPSGGYDANTKLYDHNKR